MSINNLHWYFHWAYNLVFFLLDQDVDSDTEAPGPASFKKAGSESSAADTKVVKVCFNGLNSVEGGFLKYNYIDRSLLFWKYTEVLK